MAAQGTAPVSVDNLAAALSRVGSIETLWTGKSSSAHVPGVSECSVVYVVTGPSYDSSTKTVFTIISLNQYKSDERLTKIETVRA